VLVALSGCTNILDDHVWAVSMKHIMPTVVQTVDTTDSWETLLSPSEQSGSTRASTPQATVVEQTASKVMLYSRLSQLTKLIWPRIPVKTAEMLARKFPRILVNPHVPLQLTQQLLLMRLPCKTLLHFGSRSRYRCSQQADHCMLATSLRVAHACNMAFSHRKC